MKSIFDYINYREYLKDYYEDRKQRQSWFSYRAFALKVGIDASYLAKIIMGTRHLADSSIEIVADFCGLEGNEKIFFENLVFFAKAKSDRESRVYFEKMLELKGNDSVTLTSDQYEFYKNWYNSAIRSLLEFYSFYGKKYRELGEQLNPPISTKQAKEAIALLLRLKLIAIDESGRHVLTDGAITTGSQWHSLAINSFQQSTIQLAREALDRHERHARDISTITLNINEEDYNIIKERVREFRQSIISFVGECTDPDRVYHMNIQLVPLSKLPSKGDQA